MDDMDVSDDLEDEAGPAPTWDIRGEGHGWTRAELDVRLSRLVDLKFEISKGKLFWSEATRLLVLGMLLENVGLDAAVRLGDPERWKEAVAALDAEKERG
jgi:hypothetical protein